MLPFVLVSSLLFLWFFSPRIHFSSPQSSSPGDILLSFEDTCTVPHLPLRLPPLSLLSHPATCVLLVLKVFISSSSPNIVDPVSHTWVLLSLYLSVSDIHWASTVFQAAHQGCPGDCASALGEHRGGCVTDWWHSVSSSSFKMIPFNYLFSAETC